MRADAAGQKPANAKKEGKFVKGTLFGVVAVVIFAFGVGVGNGQVSLGSSAVPSNKDLPADLDYTTVEQLYDLLKTNYDGKLDEAKLLDGLKEGLSRAAGDPYTQYLNKQDAQAFSEELSGSFSGIGAQLGENEEGLITIVSPIEGFPASQAGLRPQDIVISVDDQPTNDMSIDQAVTKIRGPKGTKVKLRILRNKTEDLTFTITRADIKIPSVKWEMLDGNVGSIQVNLFGEDTTDLMVKAADELKAQGAKSILLDLRGNPGGLLDVAVDMASLWLPKGETVLQEKRGGIVTTTYTSQAAGKPVFAGLPTVVLINAGSASASEIVAGALRDHNAATIYGEKSYGKGSVQEIQGVNGGGKLKITIARWYRPNGQNIDKKGIKPDKEIKMTEDDFKQKRDPQKDSALEYLRKQ